MKEIIHSTIRLYISICGILVNGLAINYLIMKVSFPKELVLPTPAEFMQVFNYGKRFKATFMLILLVMSIGISVINYYEDKKARHGNIRGNLLHGKLMS